MANCPTAAAAAAPSGLTCYTCRGSGHRAAECPMSRPHVPMAAAAAAAASSSSPMVHRPQQQQQSQLIHRATAEELACIESLPLVTAVIHLNGPWGKNSDHVAPGALARLKQLCVEALVPVEAQDNQNKTPHVNINGDAEVRRQMHGTRLNLQFRHLRFHAGYIDIEVGFGKHFTVAYWKGLSQDRDLYMKLISIWSLWADEVKQFPDVVGEENVASVVGASAAATVAAAVGAGISPESELAVAAAAAAAAAAESNDAHCCVVCTNAPRDCDIDCPHLCMCYECASHPSMQRCPICRQVITRRKQLILS